MQLNGEAGPIAAGGSLHAMMLDQKRAFDEVVARYARNPESITRIPLSLALRH